MPDQDPGLHLDMPATLKGPHVSWAGEGYSSLSFSRRWQAHVWGDDETCHGKRANLQAVPRTLSKLKLLSVQSGQHQHLHDFGVHNRKPPCALSLSRTSYVGSREVFALPNSGTAAARTL
jgi:hypothetical protein